jgi:hypothetical protein
VKNEIATPFGLAMTTWGVKIFNAFVLECLFDEKAVLEKRALFLKEGPIC